MDPKDLAQMHLEYRNQNQNQQSQITDQQVTAFKNIVGGESKYNDKIIKKPIINKYGSICTIEKIYEICKLILRLQLFWVIIFILVFLISFNSNY